MRWKPVHETHAIERVATSFMFAEQVPSRAWKILLAEIEEALPSVGFNSSVDEMDTPPVPLPGGQVIQVAFGPAGISTEVTGRRFRIVSGEEVLEEIVFSRSYIAHIAHRYTRWKDYRARLLEILFPYLSKYMSIISISAIKMEYWDRFICVDDFSVNMYQELFSKSSKWLPSYLLSASDLWHSHIGYFDSEIKDTKRLINMNVDIINVFEVQGAHQSGPQKLRRSAGIYTMAQDTWAPPSESADTSLVISKLNEQHNILVDIIGGILSEAASDRIALRKASS